jgi:hypothetical protein
MENLIDDFVFTFFTAFLLLVFNINGQLEPKPQHPLRASQLELVSYACPSPHLTLSAACLGSSGVFSGDA